MLGNREDVVVVGSSRLATAGFADAKPMATVRMNAAIDAARMINLRSSGDLKQTVAFCESKNHPFYTPLRR